MSQVLLPSSRRAGACVLASLLVAAGHGAAGCRNRWTAHDRSPGVEAEALQADPTVRVLRSLGESWIVPALDAAASGARQLHAELAQLETNLSPATLESAREYWRDARAAWNRCQATYFGPPADLVLEVKVDTIDVSSQRIAEVLAADTSLDGAFVETLGSTAKGFFAIESILFAPAAPGATEPEVLAASPAGARRRRLLAAWGEDLAAVVAQIAAAWSPRSGNYLQAFLAPGRETQRRSRDAIVNRMIVLAEKLADVNLGRPLGKTVGGKPQPAGAVAGASGTSKQEVLAAYAGLRTVYVGAAGDPAVTGLSNLVRSVNRDIDARIRAAIDVAVAAVEAIPEPLLVSAQGANRPLVERAFESGRDLKSVLSVDLVTALDSTLTFSPFDGD